MSTIGQASATSALLLEREDALAELDRQLEMASAGHGRVVFVAGEAGIGKTALVERFIEEHRERVRVLAGACDPLFTPRPLGPFVDIAHATGGRLHELVTASAIPYRVAEAVADELSASSPTVVVLEDLHWADEATLDVLRLLSRRIDGSSVLLVATYRDDDLDAAHPLRVVLGSLSSVPAARRLRIPRLSHAAVAELAEPYAADPDPLYRLTSGNPFYVTEVLAGDTGALIPETVRDAVLARAAALSPCARSVLESVSVMPEGAEIWLLADLAEQTDDDLAECLAAGMLTETDGLITFRHELARLAIEDSLNAEQRALLHTRALAALQRSSGATDAGRLAHHADGARGGEAVLRFAPAAAKRSSRLGAHREAAAHLRRALRYADDLSVEERASLLEQHSRECYLTDEPGETIGSLEAAVDCYRDLGDRAREGATLDWLASVLWCPGRGEEARRVGLEAVAVLESVPPGAALAKACDNMAFLHRMNADLATAQVWSDRAVELARELELEDGETLDWIAGGVALQDLATGSSRGMDDVERHIDLARRRGRDGVVFGMTVAMVKVLAFQSPLSLARRQIEEGVALAAKNGNDLAHVYLLAFRSRLELSDGRWDDAAETAQLALGERFVSTLPRTLALVTLALVRARRGDPDVWPLLDEARELSEPTGELPRIAPVAVARAEAAWLAGRPDAVRGETDMAFALALERGLPWPLGELATIRWRAGIVDDLPGGMPEPHRLQITGEPELAARSWIELDCPYDAALALAASGDEGALRRSYDELRQLGAEPAAEMVARRLRERGVRVARGPRPTTRESPAGLTRRETEILDLLAQGKRNSEIADRLVVSRRTVDHHVSAILRKLDARTRGEAVATAAELGLFQHR